MLSEPRMTIGPGPAIEPSSVTDAKLKPPAETSKPAACARFEMKRTELHDGIDLQEAVRLDAERDPDLPAAAELDRVGGDGEVALGADVDDGNRIVDGEADASQRRKTRRLRD